MTNTKFRKKALLSSVAMLLVALVALGSATFAWFAANPDVNASGLSVTTSSSTGIKIMSASEVAAGLTNESANYAQTGIVLAAVKKAASESVSARTDLETGGEHAINKPIIPNKANLNNLNAANAWITTRGTTASNGAKATGAAYEATSLSVTGTCYSEVIYTMQTDSSGTETIKSAKINWSDNNESISGAVRVALLGAGGKVHGIWKPIAADVVSDYTAASADPETPETVAATAVKTAVRDNSIAFDSADYQDVSTSANTTSVTVVVYFDGADGDATSGNAAAATAAVLQSLSVTLSI